jgi:hypothetical protein
LGEPSNLRQPVRPGAAQRGICHADGSGPDVHVVRLLWRPISSWNHQCGASKAQRQLPTHDSASNAPDSGPAPCTPAGDQRGRNTLHAGPSAAAQAVLAAKLAEWQELVRLDDIRVRTLHEITVAGEELLLAAAALTTSGLKFLEEHGGEPGEGG